MFQNICKKMTDKDKGRNALSGIKQVVILSIHSRRRRELLNLSLYETFQEEEE